MSTTANPKVDYGLRLYHEVFKLDALHFGLWEAEDPLNIEGLRAAQWRYTEQLIALIPAGCQRILDVGCGSGATSAHLAQKGFQVEALTPDAYQAQVFRQRRGDDIPLHLSRFENLHSVAPYDLILSSESAQYIPLDDLFGGATRHLKARGFFLLSDYFRLEAKRYYKTCHVHADFLAAVDKYGFDIIQERDITQQVLPTLALGKDIYRGYVLPILEIVTGFLQQKAPYLSAAVRLVLRRRLEKLRWYLYDKSEEKLDGERFARELKYAFYLLQKRD